MNPAAQPSPTCPLPRRGVVDRYFMEHRAKLIDIAAFLDRLDRAPSGVDTGGSADDFRVAAFRRALEILTDGETERARRVLELFSDPSTEVPQSANGLKGASGAHPLDGSGARP